jgi:TonB family protein
MHMRTATFASVLVALTAFEACSSAPKRPAPLSPLLEPLSAPWLVDEPPKPLAIINPSYPPSLRRSHAKGRVWFLYVIDSLGVPDMTTFTIVSSPRPEFSEAVKAAVQAWLFAPARKHGVPVRVLVRQWVDFDHE